MLKKSLDPFVGLRMRMLEIAVNSCLKRLDARRFGYKLTWSVDEETSPFLTVKLCLGALKEITKETLSLNFRFQA